MLTPLSNPTAQTVWPISMASPVARSGVTPGTLSRSASGSPERFGRPQGMAVDAQGGVLVTEALAGASGLYRLSNGEPELVLAGPHLIGVATDPAGGLVVCSTDTAYRIPPPA